MGLRFGVWKTSRGPTCPRRTLTRTNPETQTLELYQVLHDAFFKFQTKPHLTRHGDLYFESKELEVKCKVLFVVSR